MACCKKRYPTHDRPFLMTVSDNIQRLAGASLLIFANKTDINGCMDAEELQRVKTAWSRDVRRANDEQDLQLSAIRTHKWHIIQCSAITGVNLEVGLEWVVDSVAKVLGLGLGRAD